MLARLVRELPQGEDFIYEPKWDGFRCLASREGDDVDLRSRNHRPLARYFPELVEAFLSLDERSFLFDGEIVVRKDGVFDFSALLQRLHPAESRVRRLRNETPALFIAFDLLRLESRDLSQEPFDKRRNHLMDLFRYTRPPLVITPATEDAAVASEWLRQFRGDGVDGLVAKHRSLKYQPGKRAMLKIKLERTAECVVGGFRWHHLEPTVGSLLLGLYSDEVLRHVGLAASFTSDKRRHLLSDVESFVVPLEGHPWQSGFNIEEGPVGRLPGAASRWAYGEEITWVPLRPILVCEVAYDHFDGNRFRHPPRFRRWRPDRDPRSCTFSQFESTPVDLDQIVAPQ